MPSQKHQFIVDCIIRKMRLYGFEPVSLDGKSTLVSSLKIPCKIIHHRPDVIGIDQENNLCIGEAKTENDIVSNRTKEQIRDYNEANVYALFGCPKSTYPTMIKIIKKLTLNNGRNVVLKIPDELMPND